MLGWAVKRTYHPVLLACIVVASTWFTLPGAEGADTREQGFSGRLIKRVDGKQYQAQVFGKGDRLRVEYKYAIRTTRGFATIEIIRPDQATVWYVLPQQRELLVMPLTEEVIQTRPQLVGETNRTLIGPDVVGDRSTQLFDVMTERHGRVERFYEWVDEETGIILKLANQNRDWSFQYERIRISPQPEEYFEEPPRYKKRIASTGRKAEE